MSDSPPALRDVERVFREARARSVAALTRLCGDIDVAEEAVQDAFARAVERWPVEGTPPNAVGWIITTASRRAIDGFRRESSRDWRHAHASGSHHASPPACDADEDDVLRLIFTCCHPALALSSRVALALKVIAGLGTGDIARAFLVPEGTMAQRLVRAKAKIRDAGIPYRVPDERERPARLASVLAVIYLVFNQGYLPLTGEAVVRVDLCQEAIRLGELVRLSFRDDPEVTGLLALMLLTDARRTARGSADSVVLLADQQRDTWDRALIARGQSLLRECARAGRPGPYQLQAAIAAVHATATSVHDTDWERILALYDHLMRVAPGDVVALNRAVALGEVEGPHAALQATASLDLERYHPYHAVRGALLARIGDWNGAAKAFDVAGSLAGNSAERTLLARRAADARQRAC